MTSTDPARETQQRGLASAASEGCRLSRPRLCTRVCVTTNSSSMRGEERQEKLGKSGKKRRGKREAGDMEKRRGSIQRKRRDLKRKRKKQNNSRRAIRSGEFEQQVLHDVEQQAHTRTRKQSKRGREKEQRCDRTHAASEWRRDSTMLCSDPA